MRRACGPVAVAARCALGALLALAGVHALAEPPADAASTSPLPPGFRDPGVPPALRVDAPPAVRAQALSAMRSAPRTAGTALDAQVEARLRESFDAADVHHRGALTRAEARAGGFGFIDRHFNDIDTRHAGEVRFVDLQRYLGAPKAASAKR